MTKNVSIAVSMTAIVSVSVSVFLLMSVTVDQCPCIRDRVGVHDRICYILSVFVVVPIMSSVRGCGRDHIFERVTVRVSTVRVTTCTFFLDLSRALC